MASEKVNNYISKAYNRWLDYSNFQCQRAKLHDQAGDVLNEAILYLLKKEDAFLDDLLTQIKGKYTGLDAFMLSIIYNFANLPKAPYRWKYCRQRIDENADLSQCKNEDTEYDEDKINEVDYIQVIEIIEDSDLSDFGKKVFMWKFLDRKKLIDWDGEETQKEVYATYDKVLTYLLHRLNKPDRSERRTGAIQLTLF